MLLLEPKYAVGRPLRFALKGFAAAIALLCLRQMGGNFCLARRPASLSVSHAAPLAPPLRVTFLDVGKGDACVVETPSGEVMVVDTGGVIGRGADCGSKIVAPFLRKRGIKRITALVLTHPHSDHVGGAAGLLKAVPTRRLFDNGDDSSLDAVRRYRQTAREQGVEVATLRRGTALIFDRTVTVRVLAPPKTQASGRVNNSSIVLRVTYGRTSFLLTGDAEAESEAEMLASGQTLGSDVLKVAHHGSNQSTSAKFVAAVRPAVAIISVNAGNSRGYPHPDVLERLRRAGASVYRTDTNGAITCLSDGRQVCVETTR